MNYLAHIYLSDNSEENMLGNFLGDFVNKALKNEFEYSIKQGIFMHKKLDTFTDSHPDFLRSRKRISSANRRLAGVLIKSDLITNVSHDLRTPLTSIINHILENIKEYNT